MPSPEATVNWGGVAHGREPLPGRRVLSPVPRSIFPSSLKFLNFFEGPFLSFSSI